MGAWGFGPFENDCASDWLYEFIDEPTRDVLVEALAGPSEMDDVDEWQCAIAAAALVAWAGGAEQFAPMAADEDELSQSDVCHDDDVVRQAIEVVSSARDTDNEYVACIEGSADEFKTDLTKLIAALQALLDQA